MSLPRNPINQQASNYLDLVMSFGKLKRTVRTGWTRNPTLTWSPSPSTRVESVSDHSSRVTFLALLLSPSMPTIDAGRCMGMAIVHDLAECETGDIVPPEHGGLDIRVKGRLEREAMERICKEEEGGGIRELWEEYERRESAEALLVKDCDVLEMLVQALEYEILNPGGGVECGGFFEGMKEGGKGSRFEATKDLYKEILRRREELWEGREGGRR